MKLKNIVMAAGLMIAQTALAGGLLTNTNQNVAFDRQLSRDAAIGIDGVYFNPAGVAFLGQGAHLSINWQLIFQTRTIKNSYPLFANNTTDNSTSRKFQGKAFAPVLPSFQFAYNWKNFSFQSNFAVGGGGGKCHFDNGLGSFEKIVSETAYGASVLAQAVDGVAAQYGIPAMFSSDAAFGKTGSYGFTSYMRGRQYYYGLSLGAAYKIMPNLSAFAGVRGVYASCNYYGYVRNVTVGSMPLYQVLDPSKSNSADIELNSNQTGIGFTPILGIDYKLGRWNFAAKYEFKTRMRLKSESVNQAPSIGNLADNLYAAYIKAGVPEAAAQAVLSNATVQGAMGQLKTAFDTKLAAATGEYDDDKHIAADIPALLTVGVSYNPVDPLRLYAGFHYFWDRQATAYEHREDKLSSGTREWNAGVEFDAAKSLTVSAGWQNTNYGLTPDYMDDKSFVASSNSLGAGVKMKLSKKVALNLAYMFTLYGHEKTQSTEVGGPYTADYTRTNHVFGGGVDIDF